MLLLAASEVVVLVWRQGSSGVLLSVFLAALVAVIVTRMMSAIWSVSAGQLLKDLCEPLRLAGHRIATSKNLESSFEELSAYLGASAKRSQRAEEQRARLMEDLFHALSQPLTSLRCQLELGLRDGRSDQDYRECLAGALEQAERTSRLTVELRDVSEATETEVRNACCAFDATLATVAEEIAVLARIKDVRVNAQPSPRFMVAAHRERLSRALFHLLKFAVESAAPGSELNLHTMTSATGLVLTIGSRALGAEDNDETEHQAEELTVAVTFDLRLAEYILEALGGSLERDLIDDQQILSVRLPLASDVKKAEQSSKNLEAST
jgi:signal transduction histidine kinase